MRILFASNFPNDELQNIGEGKKSLMDNNNFFLFPLIDFFLGKNNRITILSTSRSIKKNIVYIRGQLKIVIVALFSHGRVSALLDFKNDIKRIENAICEEEYDIYHAHWCYEYAKACLNINPERTLITVHDWPDKVCPLVGNFYWKKRNKLGNTVLCEGKRFTAVSPYIKELVEEYNVNAEVDMIPNYSLGDTNRDESEMLHKHDSFIVITVCNGFGGIKNTQKAIKAFVHFHDMNSNCELQMYGDDYGKGEAAERWALKNGVNIEGIHFVGRVGRKQLEEAYENADVLLHTSREESFGLIYLEAMEHKTAILAGKDSGATPWVLEYGKCACLVDINDEEDILKGMIKVCNDAEYRDLIVKNGRRRLKEFQKDCIFEQYRKTYNRIVK